LIGAARRFCPGNSCMPEQPGHSMDSERDRPKLLQQSRSSSKELLRDPALLLVLSESCGRKHYRENLGSHTAEQFVTADADTGYKQYSASKAGVIALTKSLGKETADTHIAVNCILCREAGQFTHRVPPLPERGLSQLARTNPDANDTGAAVF